MEIGSIGARIWKIFYNGKKFILPMFSKQREKRERNKYGTKFWEISNSGTNSGLSRCSSVFHPPQNCGTRSGTNWHPKEAKMDKLSKISQDMFEIGVKFAEIAKQADSAKQGRAAFQMAKEAYKICLQAEKDLNPISVDYNLMFLSGITHELRRSQIWIEYCAYCEQQGHLGLKKGEFFSLLQRVGFSKRRRTDGVYVSPPVDSVELRESHKLLKELSSGSGVIELSSG